VNTASEDLTHHLEVLRQKLEHQTDYQLALNYFLEEFAGDAQFVGRSEPEAAPHLLAVIQHTAAKMLGGSPSVFDDCRVLRLAEFKFTHGNAILAGRVVLFFYFEPQNLGLMALIPGVRGATELGRFRLTGPLATHPKNN